MKQSKVSKNTKLISSENSEDFSSRLLDQYLTKYKECEAHLSNAC